MSTENEKNPNPLSKKKKWILGGIATAAVAGIIGSLGMSSFGNSPEQVKPQNEVVETQPLEAPETPQIFPETPVPDLPKETENVSVVGQQSGVDLSDLHHDPNGIGMFDRSKFKECPINTYKGHFVPDDKAILFTINKGHLKIVVYAGTSLFLEYGRGDLRAKSEDDPSMNRLEYAIKNHGNELTFYVMPQVIIQKNDYNKLLNEIAEAKKINPNKECTFVLPFDTTSEEIRTYVVNEINRRYGNGQQHVVESTQVQVPDIDDYTLYINGTPFKGTRGETLGISFTGTPAKLDELLKPTVHYSLARLQLKVDYRIAGEYIMRNLTCLTVGKLQTQENYHNYFKNTRVNFDSRRLEHAGGGTVGFSIGIVGVNLGGSNKESHDTVNVEYYIDEGDLNEFAHLVRTEIRQYLDQEFGTEPLSPIDLELKPLTSNLHPVTIQINSDGKVINPDGVSQEIFNQYLQKLAEKINADPNSLENVKKLIPEQKAEGIVKITVEDLLGIDIVKKRFVKGVTFYKLDRQKITESYNQMLSSVTHVSGTYPVSASAVALYGTTPPKLKQGFVTMHAETSNSVGVTAVVYNENEVLVNGQIYFVAHKDPGSVTDEDFCLGHYDRSRTTFNVTIEDVRHDGHGGVSAVMKCMLTSPDCIGFYISKTRLKGSVDQVIPNQGSILAGYVLDYPRPATEAERDDVGVYVSPAKSVEAFARSLTSERSYHHKVVKTGYLYASQIPEWYFSALHEPFTVNANYEYADEKGVKHVRSVFSKGIQFCGEYHDCNVEDTRSRWEKIIGRRSYRIHETCETRYNVKWMLPADSVISLPFTYEIEKEKWEYTIIGCVGGGAHVRVNRETNEFAPMSDEEYKNRSAEVQNAK